MSLFLLPRKICKEISLSMSKFWWGHMMKENDIHWRKWRLLRTHNSMVRLGFWDIETFNKVLLAKQAWRLIQNPNSLASQILKAKYFHNTNILAAKLGHNPSFLWRSIRASIELIKEGLFCILGNGLSINIWTDKWLPIPTSYQIQSPNTLLHNTAKVAVLIDSDIGTWKRDLIGQIFSLEESSAIYNIPISLFETPDKLIWRTATNDLFLVKLAYHLDMTRIKSLEGKSSN